MQNYRLYRLLVFETIWPLRYFISRHIPFPVALHRRFLYDNFSRFTIMTFSRTSQEKHMDLCPCGSNSAYAECCRPLIKGERGATTAEQLMRSRYSAFVKKEIDHLLASLHPDHRADYDEKSTRAWAEGVEWQGIKIVNTIAGGPEDGEGQVEFVASFIEKGNRQEHHEVSSFKKEKGAWYFSTGKAMPKPAVRAAPKTGRNDPCPCGSNRKFKKCCGQQA
jgi:SEC-C motif-containing protein